MSEPRWFLNFAWGRAPYALDLPEITIGRGDACPLQIDEVSAAEEHARFIVEEDEQVYLEGLSPDRPTLVNGRAIEGRVRLKDGDFIQVGNAVLTLRGGDRHPLASSSPDARTLAASELPDQVRRAVAEREAARRGAKNFVVGEQRPMPIATVMMESPLAPASVAPASLARAPSQPSRARDPQRTVEANVDELMAAVRQNADAEMPTLVAEAPGSRAPRTSAAASQSAARASTSTMLGIGAPQTSDGAVTAVAAPSTVRDLPIAKTMMAEAPSAHDLPAAPTMMAPAPSMRDLPAAATMITTAPVAPAEIVRIESVRPRGNTQADITPLPAPLPPPTSSIANLQALVHASTQMRAAPQAAASVSEPYNEDGTDVTRADRRRTEPPVAGPPISASASAMGGAATQQRPAVTGSAPAPAVVAVASQRNDATPVPTRRPTPTFDPNAPYVPPTKGPFGSFSRALDFFKQMLSLAKAERTLLKPIVWNLMFATPAMIVVSLLLLFVHSSGGYYAVLMLGVTLLYFIDYTFNALTASLMHDYVTTGVADMPAARARVKKSLSGILIFAAVSALLDVASTYARERRDVLAKIILGILRSIWTTATYVIMPAMVIEGIPFNEAFGRSKKLMEHDPTGVGAGVVALSLCSYLCAIIVIPLAFFLGRIGMHVHPIVGSVLFFMMVNLYWALSGWLKIAYSTCFYMWAKRCEAEGRPEPALAPLPLRHAMDAG